MCQYSINTPGNNVHGNHTNIISAMQRMMVSVEIVGATFILSKALS